MGGGINGCGIARELAGRGLRVILAEKGDLARGTSSKSSKLIHGGLRYLEHFALRLVRESLQERDILYKIAPHLVRQMRFILPHLPAMRPKLLIRTGLFLYDNLHQSQYFAKTQTRQLHDQPYNQFFKPAFNFGYEYSDGWVDDVRLVIANARSAQQYGAQIHTHCEVLNQKKLDNLWHITTRHNGVERVFYANQIINATAGWLQPAHHPIKRVKGSHIIVPRLYQFPQACILQCSDGRIIFCLPHRDYTILGTTDSEFHGDPEQVAIDDNEIDYILQQVNFYSQKPVLRGDIIGNYSGIRPLYYSGEDKAQKISRDYTLQLTQDGVLHIYGGKITTYRQLARHCAQKILPLYNSNDELPDFTAMEPLVGGEFDPGDYDKIINEYGQKYHYINPQYIQTLFARYGLGLENIVNGVKNMTDLGDQPSRANCYTTSVEFQYAQSHEFNPTHSEFLARNFLAGF